MTQSQPGETITENTATAVLARNIRAIRKARGVTLAAMSDMVDRSIGWLSQVERGLSTPSLQDLQAFAKQFKVPVSLFHGTVTDVSEAGTIVRAESRRSLGPSESGCVEELLSPVLGGSFEMIRREFAPGAELAELVMRKTEEAGYVVSGTFEIEIEGMRHQLGAGDSFRFKNAPLRWRNPGEEPAVVVWVVSPPVY